MSATTPDHITHHGDNTPGQLDLSRPSGKRTIKSGCASAFMIVATALAVIPLVWLLFAAVRRGIGSLFHASWWTHSMDPSFDLAEQGAIHAIVGTLEIGLITSIISVPIALMTAIVAALFVFAVVVTTFGGTQSAWASSLALMILMVPTVLRSTEEMLKLVPDSLREASFALGVSQWKTIMKVVLPTSMTGILTGIVLGLARVMGETAPLIVLLQFNTELTFNPSTPNFATLPTVITNAYTQGGVDTPVVWGAAITLIILVMGLNLIARRISRRYMRRMGK